MKLIPTKLFLLIGALALSFAVSARAEGTKPTKEAREAAELAKYDTNHDGKLDDAEKAAMKADKAKHKAEREAKEKAEHPPKKS
jgi:hypothetical protein